MSCQSRVDAAGLIVGGVLIVAAAGVRGGYRLGRRLSRAGYLFARGLR